MRPTTRHSRILKLAVLALLPLLTLAAGCGGSGGGGGSVNELCIEFTPTVETPASGTVTARLSAESGCDLAEVEIVATDVNDVFAFESVVEYDADVAAFLGYSLIGSALEADGADVTVVADEAVFGEVTIGVTRIADTGVNITGSQVIVRLAFARFGVNGSGPLALDTNCLLNSATPPQTIGNVTCTGGSFAVR